MSLPLLVRPNSIIPIGARSDRPDYDYSDHITLQVYELEDGSAVDVEIPASDGKIETTFSIERVGTIIRARRQGPAREWSICLMGIPSVKKAENAKIDVIRGSTVIRMDARADEMNIELRPDPAP
jgi:alpha-D-xyloside xylohydrolase